jgi:hypothetical protein
MCLQMDLKRQENLLREKLLREKLGKGQKEDRDYGLGNEEVCGLFLLAGGLSNPLKLKF